MLTTVLESVAGKFGPQIKDESGYLSFGKFYKGETKFEPGTVLELDVFTSEKGKRYINQAKVAAAVPAEMPTVVVTKESPKITKQDKKVVKAVAFGRELSDYELQKDRRIGVAGVVQAVISSDWYAQQAALTDLSNKDSVNALREIAKEEVTYWLDVIHEKSK